jgi:hypothetical protein
MNCQALLEFKKGKLLRPFMKKLLKIGGAESNVLRYLKLLLELQFTQQAREDSSVDKIPGPFSLYL